LEGLITEYIPISIFPYHDWLSFSVGEKNCPFSTTPNLGSKNLYFLFMLTIVTPLKRLVFQVGNLESFGVKFINKNLLGLPESVPAFVQRH
jgi:hypothetical protein